MLMRRTRPVHQPRRAKIPIALQPFVTRLAADLVALAKFRHRPQTRVAILDETNPLIHDTVLSPRHRPVLPATTTRELSPIFPVRFVTFLSGLYITRTGEVFATQPDCPHRRGPLADGVIGGTTVLCPLHDRSFDLRTGKNLSGDCTDIRTYPVIRGQDGGIALRIEFERRREALG